MQLTIRAMIKTVVAITNLVSESLKELTWYSVTIENDPIQSSNNFSEIFSENCESNFPLKKVSSKKVVNKVKSRWMTKCILKSVRKKINFIKIFYYIQTKKNENFYKKYETNYKSCYKTMEKWYYEEQFIKYKHNTKVIWKTINKLLNKSTQKKELPKEFLLSNLSSTTSNPVEIADKFNDYFVSLGPKLAKQIKNKSNSTYLYEKYLTHKNPNSIFIRPTEEHEVESEINTLRNIYKEISKPLTHIYNQTFNTGIIPGQMKIALALAIHKANENNKFENYKPISVLTCFSKVLEKLMYKRLIDFVEKNDILNKHQYGFRKNRLTEHAIIELVNKVTRAIDEGKYTAGVFLDLSHAFDAIDQRILIGKLECYGIRGPAKCWFENYLRNRKQVVKYNSVQFTEKCILTGVPQGSILGPLLFTLYINDIKNCSKIVSILLFADETSVLYSHFNFKTI